MAESKNKNFSSANDALDINELASLNDEISDDLIDHLSNQLTGNFALKTNDDSQLFEDVETTPANNDLEDAFIKKFKAKQQKRAQGANSDSQTQPAEPEKAEEEPAKTENIVEETPAAEPEVKDEVPVEPQKTEEIEPQPVPENKEDSQKKEDIKTVSGGNITEKPIDNEILEYNDSLNYIDGNTKYSKYVIYIDPENREFIDSLTVKERKNLINRLLHEQDSIAVTKRNIGKTKLIITHAILAIIVITLMIPIIYVMINASLEATINNYRTSQSMFEQLYRTSGKIKP